MSSYLLRITLLLCLLPSFLYCQISRFDNDTEKWSANDDAVGQTVQFDPTFGNPAPSIFGEDSDTGLPWYFVAPDCFLGDRAYTYGDTIRYDIYITRYSNTPYTNDISFVGDNGQLMVHNHAVDPPINTWTTYEVPITEDFWFLGSGAGPNPTNAQFLAILGDIESLEIRGEYRTGYDIAWLDNVWMGDIPEDYIAPIICQGDTFQFGNYIHTQAGDYFDELEDQNGCDSLFVNVFLDVLPTASGFDEAEFCFGQSYLLPDGSSTTAPGFYPFMYTAANGCDSTFTLELKSVQSIVENQQAYFCEGTSYILPDGNITNQSGPYTYMYTTAGGCDSTIELQLNEAFSVYQSYAVDLCEGAQYTLPDGTLIDQAGQYNFPYQTNFGCDSVIDITITARENAMVQRRDTTCNGTAFQMPDGSFATDAGIYANALATSFGCDSTVLVELIVLDSALQEFSFNRCGLDLVTLPDGSMAEEDGTFIFNYTLPWGCDSTVIFDVKYFPEFDTLVEVLLPEGTPFVLPNGVTVVDTTFNTFYNLKTQNGCDSAVALRVDYVYYNLYAPNVFQPNLDGQNDYFTLYGNEDLESILSLNIYDRWGNLVFQKTEFDGNQDVLGWDGFSKGKRVNPGVFVWTAEVLYIDGHQFVVKGDVTVVD